VSGVELCLPWEVTDDGDDHVIASAHEPVEIARVHHGQGADDLAAFIVRAANEHIGLTRALHRVEGEARVHRTRADAAEADRDALRAEVGRLRAENTRLAHLASQTMDLVVERNHYRERAETHRARIDWMQSVAAAAMRDGLAACRDLRGRLRGEGLRLARAVAVVTAVRHEHATRAAWLATLPACASAPAGVVAAEAATRAALDGAPVDVVLVVDALRAENARLRAIVEGRTTAPTRDEVDVHFAAGGRWILRWSDGTFGTARGPCAVADASEPGILTAVRWWPLDRDGRPCAWPVTP
jgi:hypothetical protein